MKLIILRTVGIVGTLLFATLFMFTYSTPTWVETFARNFIAEEVAKQLDARIDGLKIEDGEGALTQVAGALYRQNERKIEQLKAELKANVHEQLAESLTQIADPNCECRDAIAALIASGYRGEIRLLDAMNARLIEAIQTNYLRIVAELKQDIRNFSATNCAAFLLLLAATFLRPQSIAQLFVPGILLAVAVVTCTGCYVFKQNWLLTVIYSDYLGFGYLAYLLVVFALLLDVTLNKARICDMIVNAVGGIVSVAS